MELGIIQLLLSAEAVITIIAAKFEAASALERIQTPGPDTLGQARSYSWRWY